MMKMSKRISVQANMMYENVQAANSGYMAKIFVKKRPTRDRPTRDSCKFLKKSGQLGIDGQLGSGQLGIGDCIQNKVQN